NGDDDLTIIACVGAADCGFVGAQAKLRRMSRRRPLQRRDAAIFISIPVPASLGQAEVVDDSFQSLSSRDGAVIEAAPDRLAAPPRKFFRLQLPPERLVGVVRLMD